MKPPLILIVVQNLPLPRDRRVWLECNALRDAGFRVAAITPGDPGDPASAVIDGISLFKYRPVPPAASVFSFVWEFVYCWFATLRLVVRVWRTLGKPSVLQACNPPDTYFVMALLLRPFGIKFVFDQHDLCPEVFESRFGRKGPIHRLLLLLERGTYAAASHVISTNESYRAVAMTRGHVPAERVTVVRTGPDTTRLRRGELNSDLLRGRKHLVHFHGVMGPQDGVDIVIETARRVVAAGRADIFFNILGTGDEYQRLRARVSEYGLDDVVHMPGLVSDVELFDSLSTASVCLSADPPNPLNHVSTMNKTMEYMAFGNAQIAFDLKETRVSASDAARYVSPATSEAFADALLELVDDEAARRDMGDAGERRAREVLDWRHQREPYVAVFRKLTASN